MRSNLLLIFTMAVGFFSEAKIGDPPGVYDKGVYYCSHANTVFAVKTKNKNFECGIGPYESKRSHKIWETELPFKVEPEQYVPTLEQDVQWCIVVSLFLEGSDVVAMNCDRKKYRLNKKNGKLKTTS